MLFQHLAVYSFNVLNRQHCPVVLVLRVLFTVALIEVNLGKCFNEILLCMGDVVLQKLPVEAQDYLVGHFLGLEVYKAARVLPVFKDILDDFGMERGTEYGLEQVYNVVDSRYRSRKPLIVTTNLTLEELQNPEDTAHARIYDRLTEMCTPVRITGENFRKAKAREKMERLKTLLNGKEICL